MDNQEPSKVLAVVSDLFFSVKIADAVKRAGMQVEFVKDGKDAVAKAKNRPALIILDLNFGQVQPLSLIAELKAGPETEQVSVIAYVSHVQAELKQQAQDAGCEMVLARSAFTQNLPKILEPFSARS